MLCSWHYCTFGESNLQKRIVSCSQYNQHCREPGSVLTSCLRWKSWLWVVSACLHFTRALDLRDRAIYCFKSFVETHKAVFLSKISPPPFLDLSKLALEPDACVMENSFLFRVRWFCYVVMYVSRSLQDDTFQMFKECFRRKVCLIISLQDWTVGHLQVSFHLSEGCSWSPLLYIV